MKKTNNSSVFYVLVIGVLFLLSVSSYAKPEFPSGAYQRMERSALSNGYGDLASSMALLYRYRETLDRCDNPNNDISAYLFAGFLDSFISTVNSYMNRSDIWKPMVRASAESYIANASVLVQLYLQKKTAKFGEEIMDKELLEMCPRMHRRLAALMQTGMTGESGLLSKWQTANFENFLADRNWGKIARSMGQLETEKSQVCPVH